MSRNGRPRPERVGAGQDDAATDAAPPPARGAVRARIAASVGPMHGDHPRPKTDAEQRCTGEAGRRAPRGLPGPLGAEPEEHERRGRCTTTPPRRISSTRCSSSSPPRAEAVAETAEEDDGEAEHEEQGAEEQPAAAALLQRHVGQAGDVAEEARDQRQHARRGEGDEPGDQGQHEGQRKGTGLDGRCPRPCSRAFAEHVVDEAVQRGAGDLSGDARGEPALLVEDQRRRGVGRLALSASRVRPPSSAREG